MQAASLTAVPMKIRYKLNNLEDKKSLINVFGCHGKSERYDYCSRARIGVVYWDWQRGGMESMRKIFSHSVFFALNL